MNPSATGHGLMQALDVINDRWGKGPRRMGSAQARRAPHGSWETKPEGRTPAYTTEWDAMPVVRN
jgi:DNA polymerase V